MMFRKRNHDSTYESMLSEAKHTLLLTSCFLLLTSLIDQREIRKMITIQTAESALKNIYLDTIINDINTKTNPFLTMIRENTKEIASREAAVNIRYNGEGAVAATTEDGELPFSEEQIVEVTSPIKNLFGTFQITDKALRAAQNEPGAFTALLTGEMQNLVSQAQSNLNRMVYGNGNPYLAWTSARSGNVLTFPERFRGNFSVGTTFNAMDAAGTRLNTTVLTVSAVTPTTLTFTGTLPASKQDRLYLYPTVLKNLEVTGVEGVFTSPIYTEAYADHGAIKPLTMTCDASNLQSLDEASLIDFFDQYEEHCQGNPADILLTHPNVRKALFENLADMRSNVDVQEIAGGFRGFSFNGIPMYADVKCKGGTLYALNSPSFAMQQLCDWTWMTGDEGGILRRQDTKAAYTATLVKYAELLCEKPFLQGKVTNFRAGR